MIENYYLPQNNQIRCTISTKNVANQVTESGCTDLIQRLKTNIQQLPYQKSSSFLHSYYKLWME